MRPLARTLLVLSVTGLSASAVLAQGPPGGGGPGGFNFAAMQKWRDQHKYTFQLQTTVTRGIQEMERSKGTELKPAQAKQLLAVLTPYRKQPKMTQDQAKAGIQKIQRILDQKQLTAVDRAIKASERRRGGGPGGPGGAPGGGAPGGGGPGAPGGVRPGGPGGPGGSPGGPGGRAGGRGFDPARMQNFNPFNPDKSSPFGQSRAERNEKLFAFLSARAAGKAAKLDLPQGFGGRGGPGGPGGPRPGAPR
jgi:hypothetical protein